MKIKIVHLIASIILSISIVFVAGLTLYESACRAQTKNSPWDTAPIRKMEKDIFETINQKRKEKGLKPLRFSGVAYKAALYHSKDMAKRQFFSHVSPDGKDLRYRLEKFGFKAINRMWGENIAFNFNQRDPMKVAINSWMNSPGHYKNIVNRGFQYGAVGIVRDQRGSYIFTQVFWGDL